MLWYQTGFEHKEMSLETLHGHIQLITTVLLDLLVILATLGIFAVVIMYIIDVRQTKHAIRRNYPVVGRFRYLFETLGEFFRQYFFAMDREELPFNRAERSWVYRAAKNLNNTVPFGSTRSLTPPGTVIFANTAFPGLDEESMPSERLIIGPYCRDPFELSLIHI